MRPDLSVAAGICVVTGQLLALGEFASLFHTLAAFFSVALISAAILAFNDFFDVASDLINAPDRPIPSGMISKNGALFLSIILTLVGLTLGFLISREALLTALILLIIGMLYNWKLKKTGFWGNLMVSFSVGMTFIYGGVTVGLPFEKTVLFFGLLAAALDLGEEITADAMDIKGDLEIKSNSLAIKYGKEFALRVSGFIFSFVVLLTLIPFLLGWFQLILILPFLFMDAVIIYSVFQIHRSKGTEARRFIKWIYRGSTATILIFILMRLILF